MASAIPQTTAVTATRETNGLLISHLRLSPRTAWIRCMSSSIPKLSQPRIWAIRNSCTSRMTRQRRPTPSIPLRCRTDLGLETDTGGFCAEDQAAGAARLAGRERHEVCRSVCRWPLDVLDDQHRYRRAPALELQSHDFLESGEQSGIDVYAIERRKVRGGRHGDIKIDGAGEARLVERPPARSALRWTTFAWLANRSSRALAA